MSIYTIYKITCHINNKAYIGFTKYSAEARFIQHVKDSVREHFSHLHHAIQCYGKEAFTVETLYQSKDREHTHNVMEPHFIAEYDSINTGFNIQPGGEGGTGKPIKVYQYTKTLELIKVWDSAKEAAEFINVAAAALSTALRNADVGRASGLKGYTWAREGIVPKLKKGSKFVEQFDERGTRIARFHNTLAAARAVNGTGAGITQGIRHPHQKWYGFYWKAIAA